MRVLHITHNYPRLPGDHSGSFIEELIKILPGDEIESYVLCPSAPGLKRTEKRNGITIERFEYAVGSKQNLAYEGKMLNALGRGLNGLKLVAAFIKNYSSAARRIIIENKIDIVHAHWLLPGGLAARIALTNSSLPLVLSTHGTDVTMLKRIPGGSILSRLVLDRTSMVLPVSSFLGTELKKRSKRKFPCTVLSMPASDIFISGKRKTLKKTVIAVGNLTEQKRFDVLIKALGILSSKGLFLEIILIGDGPQYSNLKTLADIQGVKTEFLGRRPHHELPELLQEAGVMVLPSVGEGFGVALVEAQLSGLAVIGTNGGGQKDIIVHKQTGLLVEPDNPQALAEALLDMYSMEKIALKMAWRGQNEAMKRFLPKPTAERLMHIYRRLLS